MLNCFAQPEEVEPFVRSLQAVPKSGLHNPLKNPDRCATAPQCPYALQFKDRQFRGE